MANIPCQLVKGAVATINIHSITRVVVVSSWPFPPRGVAAAPEELQVCHGVGPHGQHRLRRDVFEGPVGDLRVHGDVADVALGAQGAAQRIVCIRSS